MSGPAGRVTAITSTGFTVTVDSVTALASSTLRLQTRALGGAADWTTQASDATPAAGDTLAATGLTTGTALEWRVIQDAGGVPDDGTHGIVTPASSIWATLLSTVSTVLTSLGVSSNEGTALPPNPPVTGALLRTLPERELAAATNVLEVEYPVEVELRHYETSDTGEHRAPNIATLQKGLRAALNCKTAADFPSITGLAEIAVDVRTKDEESQGVDVQADEIRARAVVRFRIVEDA